MINTGRSPTPPLNPFRVEPRGVLHIDFDFSALEARGMTAMDTTCDHTPFETASRGVICKHCDVDMHHVPGSGWVARRPPAPPPTSTRPTMAARIAALRPENITALLSASAQAYTDARDKAAALRAQVNGIQLRVLREGDYRTNYGVRVTELGGVLLMASESATRYEAALDSTYVAADFNVLPTSCPALAAEHEAKRAQWALVDAAESLTGLTSDDIWHASEGRRMLYQLADALVALVSAVEGR